MFWRDTAHRFCNFSVLLWDFFFGKHKMQRETRIRCCIHSGHTRMLRSKVQLHFPCSTERWGAQQLQPASSSELSRRRCWRRDDTWCHSLLHLQSPGDSRRRTGATVEKHNGEWIYCKMKWHPLFFFFLMIRVFQALNLTSVSRDAAAVLRWSGMSSWVWEWIPAGWSCHSGWRRSEQSEK